MLFKKMQSTTNNENQDNILKALELIERWLQELESKNQDK